MDVKALLTTIASLKDISEKDRKQLHEEVSQMQKEIERRDFQLRRIQKDKTIAINILNATIEDLEKKQLIIERVNEQLSEQKALIEKKSVQLAENIQKLEHSYKELEEFSYIASHDLKSPLRTIGSFAQLLKKHYSNQLDENGEEYLDFMVEGVLQMNEVINALLEYAKVSNQVDTFVDTDFNKVMAIVKANLKKEISDHQVVIISDDLPTINGNQIGFIQLFQNLLANAIKFRSEQNPVVKITCKPIGKKWIFRFCDNGIGIEEQFQEKIFSPFQRLDKQKANGTGIGLAICRKVVEMHQGNIHFEPVSRGGTCFVFSLKDQKTKHKMVNEPPILA